MIELLVPPLLGALTGCLASRLTLGLLFRTQGARRPAGVTPGVPAGLRARHHDLAVRIGQLAAARLLDGAELSQALASPGFQREIKALSQARLREFLDRDLGPLPTMVPQRLRDSFEAGVDILRWRAVKLLHDGLERPEFRQGLEAAIDGQLDLVLSRPLADWLDADDLQRLTSVLSEAAGRWLACPQTEAWLRDACRGCIAGLEGCRAPLDELLPPGLVQCLPRLLQDETPALLAQLRGVLREPGPRELAARLLSEAIGALVSPLGPVVALVKGLFSPERLKDKVGVYLDSRENTLSRWLDQDQTIAQAQAAMDRLARWLLSKSPAEILSRLKPEDKETLASGLADGIAAFLRRPQTKALLTPLLAEATASLANDEAGAAVSRLLGVNGVGSLRGRVGAFFAAVILSPKGRRLLDGAVTSLLDDVLLRRPIGPLTKILPKEAKKSLSEYLLRKGQGMLAAVAPRLLASVGVERIVTRAVESLDTRSLKDALRGLMEERFLRATLGGGLLGLLIGLATSLALTLWK